MHRRTLSFLVLGIAASAGLCVYEGFAISRQRNQLNDLRQSFDHLVAENRLLREQRDAARGKLGFATDDASAKLSDAVAQDPSASAALGSWRDRTAQLKNLAKQMPDKTIPEFQLLTDDDWLTASRGANLDSDIGVRLALYAVRQTAKNKFVPLAKSALQKYLTAHDNQLPATMEDLKPYFDIPVSDAILQRYEVTGTGNPNDTPSDGTPPILERPDAQVDDIIDSQVGIYLHGETVRSTMPKAISHANQILQAAVRSYKANHGGQAPAQLSDVQPYFTEPVDENALDKIGWGWPAN